MRREDKDMTLKLANELLLRIISFLPTKDALRTSLLSRRWRYLWTSIADIDLDDSVTFTYYNRPLGYPRCRTFFLDFVYRLLLAHDVSDITKFKVSCDVPVSADCVYSWICAVVKHNVKELDLHFPLRQSCILPACLFTSQSLIILSINFTGVLGLPYPPSGGCPCLKRLNLSQVKFSSEYSTKLLFPELSSIFPSLQQLSLVSCKWQNINHLGITSSTLVSISMDIDDREVLGCEVVVTAPKLAAFYCHTDSSIGISLAYPTAFTDASLEFFFLGEEEQVIVYQRLERLLFQMRNSKRLALSVETLQASRRFIEYFPMLQKLTYLYFSGCIVRKTVEEILEFMQKTPNLEYLCISLDVDGYDEKGENVPDCLMNKLKRLKVEGLDSEIAEMHLIKKFLKNAPNLEEIHVCPYTWNAQNLEEVRNEFVALPRSSENCSFVFEVLPDRINRARPERF